MNAPVFIRDAHIDDAAALARIHVDTWRATYRGLIPDSHLDQLSYERKEAQWINWITKPAAGSRRIVAELDHRVVGFATCGARSVDSDQATSELFALYVDPGHQDQGIGGLLLSHVLDWLRSEGHTRVHVNVLKGNSGAILFYRSKGARFVGDAQVTIEGELYLDEMFEIDLKSL